MHTFDLYRIKVLPRQQASLFFDYNKARSEILREILFDRPQAKPYNEQHWRIADMEQIAGDGVYFRIGRIVNTHLEVYSSEGFSDVSIESSPNTHVLIDIRTELCAIARKANLARRTATIATHLIDILKMTEIAAINDTTLEITAIDDPATFIAELGRAVAISSFTLTFSRPNHFDAEELIYKPTEQALEEARGTKGKLTFLGKELSPTWCQDITLAASRLGEKAEAMLRLPGASRPQKKSSVGDAASVVTSDITNSDEKARVLQRILEKFRTLGSNEI